MDNLHRWNISRRFSLVLKEFIFNGKTEWSFIRVSKSHLNCIRQGDNENRQSNPVLEI